MRSALMLSASVVLATLASADVSWWPSSGTGEASAGAVAAVDRHFAVNAAKGGRAEVEMSKLARSQGTGEVRSLAQQIQKDHEKANAELKALAERKSITLDDDLTPEHRHAHERLGGMSGREFDQAYTDQMLSDHKKTIADFERYTRDGSDTDLKKFAEKTLPTLRGHLRLTEASRTERTTAK